MTETRAPYNVTLPEIQEDPWDGAPGSEVEREAREAEWRREADRPGSILRYLACGDAAQASDPAARTIAAAIAAAALYLGERLDAIIEAMPVTGRGTQP